MQEKLEKVQFAFVFLQLYKNSTAYFLLFHSHDADSFLWLILGYLVKIGRYSCRYFTLYKRNHYCLQKKKMKKNENNKGKKVGCNASFFCRILNPF